MLIAPMAVALGLAFQPDAAGVRHVFEDALARREREFGATDPRTAQAARDLGLYLRAHGDASGARRALAQALRIDDVSPGPSAPQTLEDAEALAGVSTPAAAEPLFRRAAESSDPVVAGEALSALGGLRKAAGDLAGAMACFRRALGKAEQADGPEGTPVELLLNILLTLDRQTLGPRHEQTLSDARRLAGLYRATGRPRDAAALEQQINARPAR
ncbi:Tetratricopeptide TPR_2 repeat protein (fragment) [Candidatus Sulfopaludibacter sp. SbA3]